MSTLPRLLAAPLVGALLVAGCDGAPPPDQRIQYLDSYLDAWTAADAGAAHAVLSEDFILHDPDFGDIPKTAFLEYFSTLRSNIAQLGGARPGEPYLSASDVAYRDQGETLIAWVHWQFPPTSIEGASLFRIGPDGLRSEQLFNKTPFGGPSSEQPGSP